MRDRDRERPVGGTDEGDGQPETIDLGRRSFAGDNIANDEMQQAESDRESARTSDFRSLGDHDQLADGNEVREREGGPARDLREFGDEANL